MKNVTHPPTVLLPVMSETHQNLKYLAMFEVGNSSTLWVDFFFPFPQFALETRLNRRSYL